MSDTDRFAKSLQARRSEQGLTLEALSEITGLHYVTISRIITRKQQSITLEDAARLAKATGLSLDEVCGLTKFLAESA